ncbi:MAG: hypothetical protein HFH48_01840 [Lachnospiraceae bacterium]|nr:hypothetical protein [Lachnospiraceae bacterium]
MSDKQRRWTRTKVFCLLADKKTFVRGHWSATDTGKKRSGWPVSVAA